MVGLGRNTARVGLLVAAVAFAVPVFASAQVAPQWSAALTGGHEVPATASNATGTFTATLDEAAGTLTWSLSVPSIASATAAHIHSGAAGTNGPVVVDLFAAPTSGPTNAIGVSGTTRSADVLGPLAGNFPGLIAAVKGGTAYVNVHTSAYPGGEIRAQITSVTSPVVPFTGQIPPRGATALFVTGASTNAVSLTAALTTAGCGVEALGVLVTGTWRMYISGAPAAVSSAFPPSLAPLTPFFARCAA